MSTKLKTKPKTMLVRIHRPDKRLGYIAETYTLSGSGYPKFNWRTGWYEVDEATANKLRRALNNPMDRTSKPVFEVCTIAEGNAMDVAEKRQVATAKAPIPLPKKVYAPNRAETAAKAKAAARAETDDTSDLSDDDSDDDWDALVADEDEEDPEAQETATEDDLEDLDDLVDPETVKPTAKKPSKRATKKVTKKTSKKSTSKKSRGK